LVCTFVIHSVSEYLCACIHIIIRGSDILISSLQVYGHGKQTRSFQYVSDLVDGLIALMASNYTLPVNLGNPTEYTIEGKPCTSSYYCTNTYHRIFIL